MKSAYELAMERLEKDDPSTGPLTAEQKAALAGIDSVYDAKIAEKEVFLKGTLAKEPNPAEKEKIRKQLTDERRRLNDEREAKKNQIRGS